MTYKINTKGKLRELALNKGFRFMDDDIELRTCVATLGKLMLCSRDNGRRVEVLRFGEYPKLYRFSLRKLKRGSIDLDEERHDMKGYHRIAKNLKKRTDIGNEQ